MLDEGETDALAALAHFVGSTLVQLLLSLAHATVLGVCCLLLLRVPLAPLARRLAVRELALLLLGGYAFALEPLVQRAVRGSGLEGVLRLEPMLACLTAGALVCNRWEQRRAFAALLRRAMPPVRRRLLNTMHPRLQPHAATPPGRRPVHAPGAVLLLCHDGRLDADRAAATHVAHRAAARGRAPRLALLRLRARRPLRGRAAHPPQRGLGELRHAGTCTARAHHARVRAARRAP